MPLLGLLVGNPRLVAYAVAAAVLLGLLAWAGLTVSHWRSEAQRLPQIEAERDQAISSLDAAREANERAIERQRADDARIAALAVSLDTLRTDTARLAAAARRAPLVVTREPTLEIPSPCPGLSAGFGVCFSALAAGDPTDAAACEAAGGGVRDPVSP